MPAAPSMGVVLGSGLGGFADELTNRVEVPYSEIPGWPRSTAIGHAGKLVFGQLDGVNLAVLSGRAHLYEGYSPGRVTYAMRVLKLLGAKSAVLTNAAGGINLALQQGGLVLISDHINLQGVNPLVGANEDDFGPRFPDMSEAYSHRFREIARETASSLGITLSEGVYAAMLGPSYETPAEIRFLSCEPLIGPLERLSLAGIHWVIVGGESGPGARPMDEQWVLDIKHLCDVDDIPFFFKQWGGVQKHKRGRILNDQTWDDMPALAVPR